MSENTVSPYAAAKLVNTVLVEVGLKEIPPQMMYNYVKKGYIPSVDKKINVSDLHEWVTKYLAKKGIVLDTDETVESDVHENQLELDVTETSK
jgi:hypothetical protein